MEAIEAAEVLYRCGWSQRDISAVLKRTEKTISKWQKEGNWKEKKISSDLLEKNNTERILRLIDYQLAALERKTDLWLDEDPETTKLIDRGDLDGLQKLFTTIKSDQKKWSDYVTVCKEVLEYLETKDLALAQNLTDHINFFLDEKRKTF